MPRSSMKRLDASIRLRITLGIPLQLPLLVLGMVDATRDAFDNIGTSLEDVVGTVVVLLIAFAKVVYARDALEIMGPS